jgi:hypothetical protein
MLKKTIRIFRFSHGFSSPTSARMMVCRLILLRAFIILRQTNWLKRLLMLPANHPPEEHV